MKAYIAPLHWLISSTITRFTLNPVITGHIVMFLQLSLVSLFVFLTCRRLASNMVGIVSVFWLIHTPDLMNNLVGGLSRSWSGVVIAGYLCSLTYGTQIYVLLALTLGCLLHPPSAFCATVSYSLLLGIKLLINRDKKHLLACIWFAIASPLIYFTASYTVDRPSEIGEMVTLKEAEKMPVFNKNGGRFPFVPLKSPFFEFKTAAYKVFSIERSKTGKDIAFWSISAILLITLLTQLYTKKIFIPLELWSLLLGVISSYFAARYFAFRLYVPSRYLGWPFALFIMTTIPVLIWSVSNILGKYSLILKSVLPTFLFSLLIGVIYLIGGSGYTYTGKHFKRTIKQLDMFLWIRQNLPENATVAGHPSAIDGIQLYGMRRGYITTETYHPFYNGYYKETSRRISNSFHALYSTNINEFIKLLKSEKIDYFVFTSKYFKSNSKNALSRLDKATYFKPHDRLVLKLASYPPQSYLYFKFAPKNSKSNPDFIPYRSKNAVIVDVNALQNYLSKNGNL